MLSLKSEFKLRDRGFKDTLVLVPGWATDWRIFEGLELDYNYLLVTKLNILNFNQQLLEQLGQLKISKVSVLGFSLGGFLAAEFAAAHPEKIGKLFLLGVRKRYDPQALESIKRGILAAQQPWLYKFYLNCFARADKQGLDWFRKHLLNDYLDKLDLSEIIQGLDYLADHALHPKTLIKIKEIRMFHGQDDLIAPVQEVLEMQIDLPQAKITLLADRGHICFLNHDFRERFYSA